MPLVGVQGKISPIDYEKLYLLINKGFFGSESDAVRSAIRDLLLKHQFVFGDSKQLTADEKAQLESWAKDRNLDGLDELELGELLFQENHHVWKWIHGKRTQSVEYLLSLKN